MLSCAFEELEMKRVAFEVNTKNEKSISSLEKIGCIKEGILRSTHYNVDGTRRDTAVYSILQGDWETGFREKIKSLLK
jgi:aminoglycoside 6'-N-acetyltransferase